MIAWRAFLNLTEFSVFLGAGHLLLKPIDNHKLKVAAAERGSRQVELPEYVHTGFYNLSAYLQAAAMQAEYLSVSAISAPADNRRCMHLPMVQLDLKKIFGFRLTERALKYILNRFQENGNIGQGRVFIQKILNPKRLREFKSVFREVLGREAFEETGKRNLDAINALNFAFFDEIQGLRVAIEGLRSVLKYRKECSGW